MTNAGADLGNGPLLDVSDAIAFRQAVDDALAILRCDTNGIVTHANRVFLSLVGYDQKQLIGQDHRILCTITDQRVAGSNLFWAAIAEGRSQHGVFMMKTRFGLGCWMKGAYATLPNVEPQAVVFVGTDVSEQKRLEQELSARLDMERTLSEQLERRQAELVSAMTDLSALVATIARIAGETRMLALNASIEAARAGDSGRGFAVIAAEVAALAAQTGVATQEARTMMAARGLSVSNACP